MASELESGIERLVAPALDALGYDVVRVKMTSQSPRTLQIMAERHDRVAMTVDHCGEISRVASTLLDVEDPIGSAYSLEVSSPGIDRPLVSEGDFERFAGHVVKIETGRPCDGRKRFRGELLGFGDGEVRIAIDGEVFAVPHAAIVAAKLVLTDELIAASEELELG